MRRSGWIGLVTIFVVLTGSPCAWLRAASAREEAQPQLVILDTDIGDDIDDAFALALLLQSPEVRLLGVTTAFGDTELRARLVDRYLAAIHRENIPVEVGIATPARSRFSQADYAKQTPARRYGDGIDFLLHAIRAHPHAITLIAIGPLFNEEAALARDPTTFRELKRIVMMGGSVYRGYDTKSGAMNPTPSPEWNIVNDAHGAEAVLRSGVPVYLMPLDSTQIHLTPSDLGKILGHGSPLTDQLALLEHEWAGADGRKTPTLFDPVAAAFVMRPDLCPAQAMHLDVDAQGFTRPGVGTPNAEVCLKADEAGFTRFLVSRILGMPQP